MQEGEISTERQTENQTAKQPELPPEHPQNNENKLLKFVKKNAVCCIAFCLALVTSFIVPPDKEYLGYFDFKTLACLFSVSAAVCALKGIRFFYIAARAIVQKFKNARACVIALVCVTFVGSMLIANDMALITFLPLGYLALSSRESKNICRSRLSCRISRRISAACSLRSATRKIYICTGNSIFPRANLC